MNSSRKQDKKTDTRNPKGYPLYPAGEDIFDNSIEEQAVDSDDISNLKSQNENGIETQNENVFNDNITGSDSDVTGTALNGQQ